MPEPVESLPGTRTLQLRRRALVIGWIATAIIPLNVGVLIAGGDYRFEMFLALAFAQLVLGIYAVVLALRYRRAAGSGGLGMAIGFGLVGLGGPIGVGLMLLLVATGLAGGS